MNINVSEAKTETHRKPYYSFSQFVKENFKKKVFKIPVDAGFKCPNRDGKITTGGCTYCDNKSFSPNTRTLYIPLEKQIQNGIDFYRSRNNAEKFIVYFQAYSNTYAPVEQLKKIYDTAFQFEDVIGISVGTRPDCLENDVLELLAQYAKKYHVWIEIGIQSIHNQTLKLINRAHDFECFVDAVCRTKNVSDKVISELNYNKTEKDYSCGRFFICTHIILGLPNETHDMMIQTIKTLSDMPIDGIKIHHLYIARNTVMERDYQQGQIKVFTFDDYLPLLIECIEHLREDIVLHRVIGEISNEYIIAPKWNLTKRQILDILRRTMLKNGNYQGRLYGI